MPRRRARKPSPELGANLEFSAKSSRRLGGRAPQRSALARGHPPKGCVGKARCPAASSVPSTWASAARPSATSLRDGLPGPPAPLQSCPAAEGDGLRGERAPGRGSREPCTKAGVGNRRTSHPRAPRPPTRGLRRPSALTVGRHGPARGCGAAAGAWGTGAEPGRRAPRQAPRARGPRRAQPLPPRAPAAPPRAPRAEARGQSRPSPGARRLTHPSPPRSVCPPSPTLPVTQ